jgi:hypothetical protein
VVQCTERRAVAPQPVGMTVDEILLEAGGGPPGSGRERECCWGKRCPRSDHHLFVSWRGHITPRFSGGPRSGPSAATGC